VPYAITYVIDMDGPQSIALQLGLADQPAGRGIYLSKSNFIAALLRETYYQRRTEARGTATAA